MKITVKELAAPDAKYLPSNLRDFYSVHFTGPWCPVVTGAIVAVQYHYNAYSVHINLMRCNYGETC